MGRVRVLEDDIIALISAGEVIESPAAVVKELIENSLDAGATQIDIEIRNGGIDYISVSDNGSGILKDDCHVILKRHSTSKISRREDIDRIGTYGFRGEALASMAAVANLRVSTKADTEDVGTTINSRIGEDPVITESARPDGTTVEVSDLFANMPARKKHLSSSSREGQKVLEFVLRHAIIRNDIGFRFIRDGKVELDCPDNQSNRDRVIQVWGIDIARNLIGIDYNDSDFRLSGFIVRPPLSRGNRSREFFSVLKRPIEDKRLSAAVESAYSTQLMSGRFPICAIDISVGLAKVDANVHPNKREVRVQDFDTIVSIIRKTVREALEGGIDGRKTDSLGDYIEDSKETRTETSMRPDSTSKTATSPLVEHTTLTETVKRPEVTVSELGGTFTIIGQIFDVYLLVEIDDDLVLVDQHAAHERIVYDKLRQDLEDKKTVVQDLLEPIVLKMGPGEVEEVLQLQDELSDIGYEISSFGGNELLVSTLPEVLGHRATVDEMLALVGQMIEVGKESKEQFMDDLLKLTACHSAIRAGQKLSHSEIRKMLTELGNTRHHTTCVHGRPTMIRISKDELDTKFGRKGAEALARFRIRHGTIR